MMNEFFVLVAVSCAGCSERAIGQVSLGTQRRPRETFIELQIGYNASTMYIPPAPGDGKMKLPDGWVSRIAMGVGGYSWYCSGCAKKVT